MWRVMTMVTSNVNWMMAALLAMTMTAVAQDSTTAAKSTQPVAAVQPSQAQTQSTLAPPTTMDQVVDRVIVREKSLVTFLSSRTPIVETYLQNLTQDKVLGPVPQNDRYFLGRMDLSDSVDRNDFLRDENKNESMEKRLMGGLTKKFKFQYQPLGFSWMIFADRNDFDRQHYDFRYVHREFLGDVRCIVFDVMPKKSAGHGRFLGRIWVEDEDFSIVRLNGTYSHPSRNSYYFHMDSWRLNLTPGYWVPAYIYSEEGDFTAGAKEQDRVQSTDPLMGI